MSGFGSGWITMASSARLVTYLLVVFICILFRYFLKGQQLGIFKFEIRRFTFRSIPFSNRSLLSVSMMRELSFCYLRLGQSSCSALPPSDGRPQALPTRYDGKLSKPAGRLESSLYFLSVFFFSLLLLYSLGLLLFCY